MRVERCRGKRQALGDFLVEGTSNSPSAGATQLELTGAERDWDGLGLELTGAEGDWDGLGLGEPARPRRDRGRLHLGIDQEAHAYPEVGDERLGDHSLPGERHSARGA